MRHGGRCASRGPSLTETCGMTRTAIARLACMSLRRARAKPRRSKRNARAQPYGDLRHTPRCHGATCVHEPRARRAQSLAVPSATRKPGLTETCGMTRTAMARFACMSLRPVRAKRDVPSALQRPGRFPRAGPYGGLRHTPHCHGAFCVHEPAPGASSTATCRNAKAMTLINSPAPASPPRLPIHLTPSARAIRPAAPRAPAR